MTPEEIKAGLTKVRAGCWGGTGEIPTPLLEWTIKYIDTMEKVIDKMSPPTPPTPVKKEDKSE